MAQSREQPLARVEAAPPPPPLSPPHEPQSPESEVSLHSLIILLDTFNTSTPCTPASVNPCCHPGANRKTSWAAFPIDHGSKGKEDGREDPGCPSTHESLSSSLDPKYRRPTLADMVPPLAPQSAEALAFCDQQRFTQTGRRASSEVSGARSLRSGGDRKRKTLSMGALPRGLLFALSSVIRWIRQPRGKHKTSEVIGKGLH